MPMEIELCVIGARNIKAGDLNGKSDGYVKIKCGSHKFKTKVAKPSLCPNWMNKISFSSIIYSQTLNNPSSRKLFELLPFSARLITS